MRLLAATRGSRAEAEHIRAWAAAGGHDVVAVTGEVGPWLAEPARLSQWDMLVTPTLDTVAATIADVAALLEAVYARGKRYMTLDMPEDRQGGILYAAAQQVVARERELASQSEPG
jgi:hypothetical protein